MREILALFLIGLIGGVIGAELKIEGVAFWIFFYTFAAIFYYSFFNKNVSKQKIITDYGFKRLHITYNASITIEVNPKAILGDRFKDEYEERRFIEKILNDSDIEVDKEFSFLGRTFSYNLIRDEFSGLSLIYDRINKVFVDEIENYGLFLKCNAEKLKQKYSIENSLINRSLVLEEGALGDRDPIAPFGGMKGQAMSEIPIDWIIDALTRLSVYWGDPMNAIKTFPDKLQKFLDEYKIKYDTSNVYDFGIGIEFKGNELDKKDARAVRKHTGMEIYDERLYYHQFENQHLIVSIAVKFGEHPVFT